MLTPKKRFLNWREALKFITSCPVCAHAYKANSVNVFAEHDGVHAVHTVCPSCQSNFIAMIMTVGQGMSTVGMVTDLSLTDAKRLYAKEPFTTDDIIDTHEHLQTVEFLQTLLTHH